jgi:hypothetical protein
MKTIHKFPLDITDAQILSVPISPEPLHVGLDPAGDPCIWMLVDTAQEKYPFTVYMVGTGQPCPYSVKEYVGSIHQNPFIWHVFA